MSKLMISSTDKVFTGVCGGIAEFFGMLSTNVRIIFLIGLFMPLTIVVYFVLNFTLEEKITL
ncbi:PspC domain-containing protein [Jeotgalibacillus marinus]|uniref:PspC domain-containing protein n=1 Tax=Jeotgalibacillus marinus TaxID=86667 RepID=A0ABV3Q1B4_9BACL